MSFIEYLESCGKIDKKQKVEILDQSKNNHEKAGQIILKNNVLPRNEFFLQLQLFVERNTNA